MISVLVTIYSVPTVWFSTWWWLFSFQLGGSHHHFSLLSLIGDICLYLSGIQIVSKLCDSFIQLPFHHFIFWQYHILEKVFLLALTQLPMELRLLVFILIFVFSSCSTKENGNWKFLRRY